MYRIIVNECRTYRVEVKEQGEWHLCVRPDEQGAHGQSPREFENFQAAMDWIQEEIEEPEWERKRTTWTVVEEISDEQEKS